MNEAAHTTPPSSQTTGCAYCGGVGWYADHEDECYEHGDCNCSGIQVQCEQCAGTGQVPVEQEVQRGY